MKFRLKLATILSLGVFSYNQMVVAAPTEEKDMVVAPPPKNFGDFGGLGIDVSMCILAICDEQSRGRMAQTSRAMNELVGRVREERWKDPWNFVYDADNCFKKEGLIICALKVFGNGNPPPALIREQLFFLLKDKFNQ